jgi:hypothetical protein
VGGYRACGNVDHGTRGRRTGAPDPGETIARVRIELSLPDVATLSAETLKTVRRDIGSDYVVSGAFLDLGVPSAPRIRLDLHLQNAASGETSGQPIGGGR